MLPPVRLRVEHLQDVKTRMAVLEGKINSANVVVSKFKNPSPTTLGARSIGNAATFISVDCGHLLAALNDGRRKIERSIEKLETVDRMASKFLDVGRDIGHYAGTGATADLYDEAVKILSGAYIFLNPVGNFGKIDEFITLSSGLEKLFKLPAGSIPGWRVPGLGFLDNVSKQVGLKKYAGLLQAGKTTSEIGKAGNVLGKVGTALTFVGVGIDSFQLGKAIAKGDGWTAGWKGAKVVVGATALLAPPPVNAVALVAYSVMGVAELIYEHREKIMNAGKWAVRTASAANEWVNDKASSAAKWATNRLGHGARRAWDYMNRNPGVFSPLGPALPLVPAVRAIGAVAETAGKAAEGIGRGIGKIGRSLWP